jgi:hypothetical protein
MIAAKPQSLFLAMKVSLQKKQQNSMPNMSYHIMEFLHESSQTETLNSVLSS